MEDTNEHMTLCSNYIEKVEYSFIKKSLERVLLKAEKYRLYEIQCKIESAKQWRLIKDFVIVAFMSTFVVILSILLTDYMVFRQN
jgi:hypothetical protein